MYPFILYLLQADLFFVEKSKSLSHPPIPAGCTLSDSSRLFSWWMTSSSLPAVSGRLRRSFQGPPGPGFYKPCSRLRPSTRCPPVYSEERTFCFFLIISLKASKHSRLLVSPLVLTSANLDQLKDFSGLDGWGMFFFTMEGPIGPPGGGGMPPIGARPKGGPPGGGGGGGGGGIMPPGGGGGGPRPAKPGMGGGGGRGPPGGPGAKGGPPGTRVACLCRDRGRESQAKKQKQYLYVRWPWFLSFMT